MSRASTIARAFGEDGALNAADVAGLGALATRGTVSSSHIDDSAVTAAKLHTTAVTDKLGYTPLGDRGAANAIADWNGLDQLGSYRTAPDGADANAPTGGTLYGNLVTIGSGDGRSQVYVSHDDHAQLHFRTRWNSGDWKSWRRAHTDGYVRIGESTNAWHDLETTVLGAGDGVIRRRSRLFSGAGTQNIFTARVNYGWAGYFYRVHLYEFGYLGTGYRRATFSQHGTGTNIIPGAYSPYWRYEMVESPSISQLGFTATGPEGGGTDVGYYTVNAQVTVAEYTNCFIVVEFDQGRVVSNTNPPSKNEVYFY